MSGINIAKANKDMVDVLAGVTLPSPSHTINKPEVVAIAAGTSFDPAAAAKYGINFPGDLKGVTLTYGQPFITSNGQLAVTVSATKSPSLKVTTKVINVGLIGLDNADKVEAITSADLNLPNPDATVKSVDVTKTVPGKTGSGVDYTFTT